MFHICILLLGLHAVCGQIDIVDPGFGVPIDPGFSGPYPSTTSCDTICDEETHETGVCGTDGIFYHTKCDFNKAVCAATKAGDVLMTANYGPCIDLNTACDVALHARCSYPITNIVNANTGGRRASDADYYCGSDKRTYSSACQFRQAQCRQQQQQAITSMTTTQLTLDHMGKCVIDKDQMVMIDCTKYTMNSGSSQIAVETAVQPSITCPRTYNPVCANAANVFGTSAISRTFSNACSLCQYMISLHKLTSDNMVTYALHEGPCSQNTIFG
ncbi:hypothetical protein ACF0H5_001284 [Mactra antiquata]